MKKLILILPLLASICLKAQQTPSCCSPDAMEAYARNASDKAFTMSHDEPVPFTYVSERGKDIMYKTADGTEAHAWESKAVKPTDKWLFVIHEWWGLNDHIKQTAEKLGDELGVNVIALDLYDNKVAATREDAAKAMQSVTKERSLAIINGAFAYAGPKARVFTIGWCFGGGWSLQTALAGGKQSAGCVMYYGQPEKDVDRLKTLNCDVIGFFGNLDQWPSPQMVDDFVKDMEKAGKKLEVHRYEATHAFANPSNPNYNKEATEDSWKRTVAFFRARM
jgi:carboxymethylenebutenolidase